MKLINNKQNTELQYNEKDLENALMVIDKKREKLKEEKARLEAELKAQELGERNPVSIEIDEVLKESSTTSEIQINIEKINYALNLPNYVDADFRKHSIPYVESILNEYGTALSENIAQIKTAKNEIEKETQKVENLEAENEVLVSNIIDKLQKYGLDYEARLIYRDCSATDVIEHYKRQCKKYA